MARLAQVRQTGTGKQEVLLLIDHSVGRGGTNRTDDVQLIQFLLNVANRRNGSPFYNALTRRLVVDGRCGPQTLAAILKYQQSQNRQPGFSKGFKLINEDGLVTASSEMTLWGGAGYHFTTMHSLNDEFQLYLTFQWIELDLYVIEPLFSKILAPLKAIFGSM